MELVGRTLSSNAFLACLSVGINNCGAGGNDTFLVTLPVLLILAGLVICVLLSVVLDFFSARAALADEPIGLYLAFESVGVAGLVSIAGSGRAPFLLEAFLVAAAAALLLARFVCFWSAIFDSFLTLVLSVGDDLLFPDAVKLALSLDRGGETFSSESSSILRFLDAALTGGTGM